MQLKLMYITNNENIAKIAEGSGVDWIFIDLEINNKEERQGHLNTVISRHQIEDIRRVKKVLSKADLLVRVNPIYAGSKNEIDRVIKDGANIVMLPFFKTKDEVAAFIDYVNARAKTCLLCETAEAVENIDSILELEGIDFIHIGLNDLHLAYKMKFMFEPLADGTVDMLCKRFKAKGITYGFGGIARLGQGVLPAEHIVAEHYRLGSSMAILSRSFYHINNTDDLSDAKSIFTRGVNEIRDYENSLLHKDIRFFEHNHVRVKNKVLEIRSAIKMQHAL